MARQAIDTPKMLHGWMNFARGLALGAVALGSGCVSAVAYEAKIVELERLRVEAHERDARYVERLDRLSARLDELERQSARSEQRITEAVRAMVKVHDAVRLGGETPLTRTAVQPHRKSEDWLMPVF
jgi:hypothetical protein